MNRHAGALTRCVQPGDGGLFGTDHHLTVHVRGDPAHPVVGGRLDRHRFAKRLDAQVDPGELGDVGDLPLDHLGIEVPDVEVHVVLAVDPSPFLDLLVDGPADHVPRREVLDGGGVALHESLALAVDEDPAFAPDGLGDEDAHLVDAGRVELEELHVLEGKPSSVAHGEAVTGEGVGVRGDLEDLPVPAGGEQHGPRAEHVPVASS